LALVVSGLGTLVLTLDGIAQGRPPLEHLTLLIAICPAVALGLFIQSRVLQKRTLAQKSANWMIAFAFLMGETLAISWQALFRPVTSYDRFLGAATLLGALGLGCLSVLAFRRMRIELVQTDSEAPVEWQARSAGAKFRARAIGLGILAGLSLLISIQQIFQPFQRYERELGWGGLVTAIVFGCLSFRAYQNMKMEQLQVVTGEPPPVRSDATGFRNPKLGLVMAVILALLVIQGDVRVIMKGDLEGGIFQMAFWLALIGYYGFHEYGRMKRMKSG